MDDFQSDWDFVNYDPMCSSIYEVDNQYLRILESAEEEIPQESIFSLDYLNDRDYSLNSPLISDEINEFLNYLNQRDFRDGWNIKSWESSKRWIKDLHIKSDIKATEFHTYLGYFLHDRTIQLQPGRLFLTSVEKGFQKSKWVVDAYIKGITKTKNVCHPDIEKLPDYAYRMMSIFLTFHWIILIMNGKNKQEILNLISSINKESGFYISVCPVFRKFTFSTPCGEFLFDRDFLIDENQKRILSHTHCLLIKDLAIARYNSLFFLFSKSDNLFQNVNTDEMIRLYQLGDKGLIKHDNDWYDRVALIEPLCNLKFVQLSHIYRPLIPIDPSFNDYVWEKINTLCSMDPSGLEFFSLINQQSDLGTLLHIYGSFRHWGHPEIQYLDGLKKLHSQVQLPKTIDEKYAKALASDLAFLVLRKEFRKKNTWAVDKSLLLPGHPLSTHFINNTFPSDLEIHNFGDHWHELPLKPCFDVPDVINPSTIYSDKSHSMTRSEVNSYVSRNPGKKIPSLRVLSTYLSRPATNWKDFLKKINDYGLDLEDLIIGLKAKEREIKKVGRFFALMSWKLREYFVSTEYLIKTHFVPLFGGLTMADDFATVTKKMLDRSAGQGETDYTNICYANHIDYEKWNNHQRKEATDPTFRVMGQFLGFPNLIVRTHEFFEKSLIYYNNRGDLLKTDGKTLSNSTDLLACWNGQKGGLEGLRQKGWSILNLLVIRREARLRNTKVSVLAQGDNQVVCTQYNAQKSKSEEELIENLLSISKNNKTIMDNIRYGTGKLGLIINESETIQGTDYLNYGKVPIFRGNICPLPTKRWARVCCVTNDQMPSMANMMATVVTNALTTSNFSSGFIPSMMMMLYFGNLVLNLILKHNPATRAPMEISDQTIDHFRIGFLFLDPALGGISGANLNRFLIRGFPDPVTESLSFWKIVYENSVDQERKDLVGKLVAVKLRTYDSSHFTKLLENPSSLNLIQGISPETTLKEHIKDNLISTSHDLKNLMIRDVLHDYTVDSELLIKYLLTLSPCFPRFLSEFKAATFVGITESLIGLFQNSKTIRTIFRKNFVKDINKIILKAEFLSIQVLKKLSNRSPIDVSTLCTSEYADQLRFTSWGQKIYGATIPHPSEMFNTFAVLNPDCEECKTGKTDGYLITRSHYPGGVDNLYKQVGPYPPYLGSSTTESTSILSPWEQESKVPIIEKAKRLRRAIGWFIKPQSPAAEVILMNLKSLTGEEWKDLNFDFQRTGSALHRFGSERQSSGGFNAISPTSLSHHYTTTDKLHNLQSKNYDFMFQSSILYAQATSLLDSQNQKESLIHHHISCTKCIREIDEVTVESEEKIEFRDYSTILNSWKPTDTPWIVIKASIPVPSVDWTSINPLNKHFVIGRIQGFAFGLLMSRGLNVYDFKKLFPQVLVKKLIPAFSLRGMADGLIRASSLHILQRHVLYKSSTIKPLWIGSTLDAISTFSENEAVQSFISHPTWLAELNSTPHKTPASFPQNRKDSAYLILNYLRDVCLSMFESKSVIEDIRSRPLLVFSDFNTSDVVLPFGMTHFVIATITGQREEEDKKTRLRMLSDNLSLIYQDKLSITNQTKIAEVIQSVPREVRHAVKEDMNQIELESSRKLVWREEYFCLNFSVPVVYSGEEKGSPEILQRIPHRDISPIMSGLRLFQFATGSHYKMYSILKGMKPTPRDFACLGDGSGGLTSLCLRIYPHSRGLFNSLVKLKNTPTYGQEPSPPATLLSMGKDARRCVNFRDATLKPNDLTNDDSWKYLIQCGKDYNLKIDLVIIDCETDDITRTTIEDKMLSKVKELLTRNGTLIYKTYLNRIYSTKILEQLGCLFPLVDIYQTEMTSLHSEEIYLMCSRSFTQPRSYKVDWLNLDRWWGTFLPFQSEEREFQRCTNLIGKNLFLGVPPELRLPVHIQMSEILSSLGVPTGMSISLGESCWMGMNENKTLAIMILSCIFAFRSSSKAQSHLTPPSDNISINLLTIIYGFSYYLVWITEDYRRFSYLNKQFNRKTPIFFDAVRQIEGIPGYTLSWSLSKHYKVYKAFYLDKEKAKLTQLIRALASLDFQSERVEKKRINSIIKAYQSSTDFDQISQTTGILDLLKEKMIPSNVKLHTPDSEIRQGASRSSDNP